MTSIDEAARHALYRAFEELIGPDQAATFMAMMAFDPDELATKSDLNVLSSELRIEMTELRTDLRTEMADLRAEMADRISAQTRTLTLGLVGAMATMTSLTLAAVGLLH